MEGAGRLCQNGRRRDSVTCAGPWKLSAPTRLFCDLPSLVKRAQHGQIPCGGESGGLGGGAISPRSHTEQGVRAPPLTLSCVFVLAQQGGPPQAKDPQRRSAFHPPPTSATLSYVLFQLKTTWKMWKSTRKKIKLICDFSLPYFWSQLQRSVGDSHTITSFVFLDHDFFNWFFFFRARERERDRELETLIETSSISFLLHPPTGD